MNFIYNAIFIQKGTIKLKWKNTDYPTVYIIFKNIFSHPIYFYKKTKYSREEIKRGGMCVLIISYYYS
jgi:hypothetical protein